MISIVFPNPISETMETHIAKDLYLNTNAFTLKTINFLLKKLSSRKMISNYLLAV